MPQIVKNRLLRWRHVSSPYNAVHDSSMADVSAVQDKRPEQVVSDKSTPGHAHVQSSLYLPRRQLTTQVDISTKYVTVRYGIRVHRLGSVTETARFLEVGVNGQSRTEEEGAGILHPLR